MCDRPGCSCSPVTANPTPWVGCPLPRSEKNDVHLHGAVITRNSVIGRTWRRVQANDRERSRMAQLNDALRQLRAALPPTYRRGFHSRMSKIETLRVSAYAWARLERVYLVCSPVQQIRREQRHRLGNTIYQFIPSMGNCRQTIFSK
ncbi:unnamed protein product [Echinostoma caproni]|uniref:BHLH domain-containing protein n=1 Tax=Echinostoma caproni TaxID=27848 RepID=A0A183BG58_9TREM|nr:unnamed protein product [Echinostoma caproni]